jgi:hypothetical protein
MIQAANYKAKYPRITDDMGADIFALERELESAQAETDAVIMDIFGGRHG